MHPSHDFTDWKTCFAHLTCRPNLLAGGSRNHHSNHQSSPTRKSDPASKTNNLLISSAFTIYDWEGSSVASALPAHEITNPKKNKKKSEMKMTKTKKRKNERQDLPKTKYWKRPQISIVFHSNKRNANSALLAHGIQERRQKSFRQKPEYRKNHSAKKPRILR